MQVVSITIFKLLRYVIIVQWSRSFLARAVGHWQNRFLPTELTLVSTYFSILAIQNRALQIQKFKTIFFNIVTFSSFTSLAIKNCILLNDHQTQTRTEPFLRIPTYTSLICCMYTLSLTYLVAFCLVRFQKQFFFALVQPGINFDFR